MHELVCQYVPKAVRSEERSVCQCVRVGSGGESDCKREGKIEFVSCESETSFLQVSWESHSRVRSEGHDQRRKREKKKRDRKGRSALSQYLKQKRLSPISTKGRSYLILSLCHTFYIFCEFLFSGKKCQIFCPLDSQVVQATQHKFQYWLFICDIL